MEAQELYRGRLIDHIQFVVKDFAASTHFYEAIMEVLGVPMVAVTEDFFMCDELGVSSVESPASAGRLTGRSHIAFQAWNKETVDAFHAAGLKAGGKDNGKPGERPYHPGYYAAFLLDPDGNNIEAVFHGPAKRSSEAIKITW